MSASRTLLGRLFQSLGAKWKKDLLPAVDFDILGIIKWPEFLERSGRGALNVNHRSWILSSSVHN